jgi:hypothetical protein
MLRANCHLGDHDKFADRRREHDLGWPEGRDRFGRSPMAGRVVVVIGASAGVGRTVAHACGSAGDGVGLLARGKVAFSSVLAPFTRISIESSGGPPR